MNKTPRLSKSGIEYLDYVWNFYSGCHNWKNGVCPVGENCWAKGITERFKHHYPNGFEPTFYPEAFLSPLYLEKPSILGCAFMGDLFGDWVDPDRQFYFEDGYNTLRQIIFFVIKACPQHRFLFLTKCPQNLPQWSPFPDNCWVGVTATTNQMFNRAVIHLSGIEARIKYLSIEPMLEDVIRGEDSIYVASILKRAGINRIIIGAQTKPTVMPKIEWVEEIVEAADKAGIPVFLKDNLRTLTLDAVAKHQIERDLVLRGRDLRQEMPV